MSFGTAPMPRAAGSWGTTAPASRPDCAGPATSCENAFRRPASSPISSDAMAIRPIRLFGDPVLRTAADPVTDFDKQLRGLVKDLQETLDNAQGAGIAAPQIGVGLRGFAYHVDDRRGDRVNPGRNF